MAEDKKKEIAVIEITEEYMKERLYEFRGRKVMLDSDLAEFMGMRPRILKGRLRITLPNSKAMILCLN